MTRTPHEMVRTTVFAVPGDLDMASAPECHRALEAHAAFTLGDIVCDCTDLVFLDAAGIGMLVEVFDELAAQDRGFRLVNVHGIAFRALQTCGLLGHFRVPTERGS